MRSHDSCLVYGGHKTRFGLFKRVIFPILALQSNVYYDQKFLVLRTLCISVTMRELSPANRNTDRKLQTSKENHGGTAK